MNRKREFSDRRIERSLVLMSSFSSFFIAKESSQIGELKVVLSYLCSKGHLHYRKREFSDRRIERLPLPHTFRVTKMHRKREFSDRRIESYH